MHMKDVRAIFLLIMWEIWKHCNVIVLNGATPSLRVLVQTIEEEGRAWKKAGLLKGDVEALFGDLAGLASARE